MEDDSTLWYAAGGLVGFCFLVIVIVLIVRASQASGVESYITAVAKVLQFRRTTGSRDAACTALALPPFALPSGSEPVAFTGRVEGVDAAIGAVKWAPKGGAPRHTAVVAVKLPRDLATKFEVISSMWADLHPSAMAGFQQSVGFVGTSVVRSNDADGAVRFLVRDPVAQRDIEAILTKGELGRVSNDTLRAVLDPSKDPVAAVEELERLVRLAKKLCA